MHIAQQIAVSSRAATSHPGSAAASLASSGYYRGTQAAALARAFSVFVIIAAGLVLAVWVGRLQP